MLKGLILPYVCLMLCKESKWTDTDILCIQETNLQNEDVCILERKLHIYSSLAPNKKSECVCYYYRYTSFLPDQKDSEWSW